MKDLSRFAVVKSALESVVAESDVNNGTQGVDIMCHFWQSELIFDEKRQEIQKLLTRAILDSNLDKVKEHQMALEKLPKSKVMMEFRLLKPIPRIQGTKVITDGEKQYKIHMENVMTLFVPEDAVKLGLLEYEETDEKLIDAMGRETTIIKLRLKKGIIDVTAPRQDRFGKILVPKRAMVTALSFGAMQNAGKLLYNETVAKNRRFGFEEVI